MLWDTGERTVGRFEGTGQIVLEEKKMDVMIVHNKQHNRESAKEG